jgi:hypothetical protein
MRKIQTLSGSAAAVVITGTCLLASFSVAHAQSLTVSDTTVSVVSLRSNSGAADWRALGGNPKVQNLVAYAQQQLGSPVTPQPNAGFSTDAVLRYARPGANTDLATRVTIIPLAGKVNTRTGPSAVLMVGTYTATPDLVVPRLLIRRDANDWTVTEYSFRRDNRVMEMAAVHGDCLLRSSLKIVEQRNGRAHSSLRAAMNQSVSARNDLGTQLRQVYDARSRSVGQGELLLATGLISAANIEEEYDAGYISGTLDRNFKPERRDNPLVAKSKEYAKEVMKDMLKQVGKKIWSAIAAYFGFGFG